MLAAELEAAAGAFRLRLALEVEEGRTLVLFGPSGAGKSLLLRAVAGVHRPVWGRITLDGRPLLDSARGVDVPPQARRLGYVPQNYALFPHLTVNQNVAFGLRGLPGAERHRRVDDLLAQLQLEGLAQRRPAQLSGGQQQRVAIARALATEPRVLLLDEPFAALDAPLRRVLRRELHTLRHRFGFAALLVTHDLGDACALGDAIAVVVGGEIVQLGSPQEVLTRPATPLVARLTGLRNVFPGRVARVLDGALEVQTARFLARTPPYPFPAGAGVHLYVRPDAVSLVRPGHEPPWQQPQRPDAQGLTAEGPTGATLLRGRIVDEQHLGALHTLYFRLTETAVPLDTPFGIGASGVPLARTGAEHDLEVDIAAHPYQALGVAKQREWTLALLPLALHVTGATPLARSGW
ncbi:MAG: ABC transporter ATP-binding protein [Chloroflexota bacterium]|nr:ABC transporter ATP-binding protein [Chloroflexota bacterium]